MPNDPAPSAPPAVAANDNGPGSRAAPAVVLVGLVDLLAEVAAARLVAANDNIPALTDCDE